MGLNRDTEILVGAGGAGKTVELIKRSAESGIYILVANRKRAETLAKQAEDMKLYIPFPVTLQEWLRSADKFHGSSIRRDGILIDDIDDVIKELFSPLEIKAVALRTPCMITNLDQSTAKDTKEIFADIEKRLWYYRRYIDVNPIIAYFFQQIDEIKQKYEGEQ